MTNPLEQSMKLHKDYFLVPLPAILPFNHDKFINIPNWGDDVDPDEVGTTITEFPVKLNQIFTAARTDVLATPITWTKLFRFVVAYDMMYSTGSLLKYFGFTIGDDTADAQVDAFWSAVKAWLDGAAVRWLSLDVGTERYYIEKNPTPGGKSISLHEAISRMRDEYGFTIDAYDTNVPSSVSNVCPSYLPGAADETPLDTERYHGYQIICSHFYSNDHVDAIINADLYRQNLRSLIETCATGATTATFLYNGVQTLYDTCSAFMFNTIHGAVTRATPGTVNWVDIFDYLRLVFGFNRSLRFGDYFTGCRTRPLGIGPNNAVDVQVNANMVNVVEVMQKSWMARLLAQVARVGRRTPEQTKAQFPDSNIAQDWHEPIWLGDTAFDVFAEKIDNTSSEQYSKDISTTSVWVNANDGFGFKCTVPDYHCCIIGISWFDISRFYARATERTCFHIDRFDKFQPMLQFDGDQKIYLRELRPTINGLADTFGYTGKFMEYKQRFNQAAGGFANGALPGIIFLADAGRVDNDIYEQNSDYIRSYPSEIDSLYPRLTGYSLGTYFHFWMINDNFDDCDKPMAFNPQLM